MDVRPLQESSAFRRLWVGSGLSAIGNQMTVLAVTVQVFALTHSSIAVGAIGLFAAIPAIALALAAGTLGDAVDRRKIVLIVTSCQVGVSVLFAAQAFVDLRQLWLLYALVALQFLLGAVNIPARTTFMPRLLPREQIPAGAALNMFSMHVSLTAGPALAGFIAGTWGVKTAYVIDVLSFGGALYGIARLPAMPPDGAALGRPGFRAIVEGLRFIHRDRIVSGALLTDLCVTLLGVPTALLPAINANRFGGTATTLGLLMAASSIGGLVASVISGPVRKIKHHGRAMLIGSAAWGAAIVGFGFAQSLWVAVPLLVFAGAVDTIDVVLRTSMIQTTTRDRFRGRVSATEYVVGVAAPQVGSFRAGALGTVLSPATALIFGGISTILGIGLIALGSPAFVRYEANAKEAAES